MAFPVNFHLGKLVLNSHLIFEELGFILGFRLYLFLRKRTHDLISSHDRVWILCGAAIGALVFSRLLGALEYPAMFFNSHTPMLYYYTNKTIIGGLLGGLVGIEITKKFLGVKTSSGDLFTFPIILALAVGRIGCFLAGPADLTYGTPTSLPWGIDPGDSIKIHPAPVYEIIFLFILALILLIISRKHQLKNGYLFKMFITSYLVFRFFIEFIKTDARFSFGLSVLQLTCLAGLLYYYKFFINSPFEPVILPQTGINASE